MSIQNFIQAEDKVGFEEALGKGKVTENQIAFIESDDLIWARGKYYGAIPNNEDLTKNKSGELQFSDRLYSPENFSGKGYKILRKNMVAGKNVLTQEMITDPNTIYEVRYDFDLEGAEITIPEGCVLDFKGGSLRNGTVQLNNTTVSNNDSTIFKNIILLGDGNTSYIESTWFEFPKGELIDSQDYLQSIFNLGKNNLSNIVFKKDSFYIRGNKNTSSVDIDFEDIKNSGLYIYSNTVVDFGGSSIYNLSKSIQDNGNTIFIYYGENIKIKNLNIYGTLEETKITNKHHGIFIMGGNSIVLDNIKIFKFGGDGILISRLNYGPVKHLSEPTNIKLNRITSQYNGRQGMSIICGTNIIVENSMFLDTGYYNEDTVNPGAGIDIEPNQVENTEKIPVHVVIRNCKFINNKLGLSAGVMPIKDSSIERKVELYDCYITDRCYLEPKDLIIDNCKFDLKDDTGIEVYQSIYIRSLYTTIKNSYIKTNKLWLSRHINFNDDEVGKHEYLNCTFKMKNFTTLENDKTLKVSINNCNLSEFSINNGKSTCTFNLSNSTLSGNNINYQYCNFMNCNITAETIINTHCNFDNCIIKFTAPNRPSTHIIEQGDKSKFTKCYIVGNENNNTFNVTESNKIQFNNCVINGRFPSTQLNESSLNDVSKYLYNIFNSSTHNIIKSINNYVYPINIPSKRLIFHWNGIPYDAFGNKGDINYSGITSERPIDGVSLGFTFFDKTLNQNIYWNGNIWIDSNGNPIDALKQGTSSQRPVGVKAGFYYFDTDINKPIWKKEDTGTAWVDSTGIEV